MSLLFRKKQDHKFEKKKRKTRGKDRPKGYEKEGAAAAVASLEAAAAAEEDGAVLAAAVEVDENAAAAGAAEVGCGWGIVEVDAPVRGGLAVVGLSRSVPLIRSTYCFSLI